MKGRRTTLYTDEKKQESVQKRERAVEKLRTEIELGRNGKCYKDRVVEKYTFPAHKTLGRV